MMMSQRIPLTTFATCHEAAISWIDQRLSAIGLVVKPTFDLQVAKSAHTGCTCPYHGTAQCDCQIVVLLVYGGREGPISLVVHSQDGSTYLSMADKLSAEDEDTLVGKIIHALGYQNINTS
jgi:hypothetical protein